MNWNVEGFVHGKSLISRYNIWVHVDTQNDSMMSLYMFMYLSFLLNSVAYSVTACIYVQYWLVMPPDLIFQLFGHLKMLFLDEKNL